MALTDMKPAPDAEDPANMAPDPGMDGPPEADESAAVLCTVLKNSDGTYQVVSGDETDEGDMAAPAGADAMPPEGSDMAASPQGQSYDEAGAVLKAVLDLLTKDQEASGGTAQSHFEAGFDDQPKGAPPKA